MAVKQRRGFADYLNAGTEKEPDYVLMGAGYTKLDESPAAQTKSRRYVNDKSQTKSISGYDDSFPFEADQIIDERAVDFIRDIGENRKTGAEAETDYVRVDLDKKIGDTGTEYEARKFHVAIEVADFPDNDGEMTMSGNLLGVGDMVPGKFDTSTKTFTAADTEAGA